MDRVEYTSLSNYATISKSDQHPEQGQSETVMISKYHFKNKYTSVTFWKASKIQASGWVQFVVFHSFNKCFSNTGTKMKIVICFCLLVSLFEGEKRVFCLLSHFHKTYARNEFELEKVCQS